MDDKKLEELIDKIVERVKVRLQEKNQNRENDTTQVMRHFHRSSTSRIGTRLGTVTSEELSQMIDHTMLKPDATKDEIEKLCQEAAKYKFATVCVNSSYIPLAAKILKGSSVKAIAVVGFPLGAAATVAKVSEAEEAIQHGAEEIDMVINIGALKNKDYTLVHQDIHAVVHASSPKPVKVILETSTLTEHEKIIACALAKSAGAAFVKTSTGFGGGGATVEDIRLMREIVGEDIGVKASGGIRSFEDAQKMIDAGANRLGASASVTIVLKSKKESGGY